MKYKKLEITDKEIFNEFFLEQYSMSSVHDFATVYLWNTGAEFFCDYNMLLLRKLMKGRMVYHIPLVRKGSLESALRKICDDTEYGKSSTIVQITEDDLTNPVSTELFKNAVLERDMSDYIYNTIDLTTLSGKRFHAKRNHINRFTSLYNYSFREINFDDSNDYNKILNLYTNWLEQSEQEANYELTALKRAFECGEVLGLKGGIIEVEGKPIAFSIVSKSVHNIGQVQFEKADINYDGAYAVINNITAKAFLADCQFINRQEDLGIEGLRKSKLSYNPYRILLKYHYEC